MHFDNGDITGPVNGLGNLILAGIPSYKFEGLHYSNMRGRIVIVYSPTQMNGQYSLQYSPHGLIGTKWSVEQLQGSLHFFTDPAAAWAKAQRMDFGMGRLIGSM